MCAQVLCGGDRGKAWLRAGISSSSAVLPCGHTQTRDGTRFACHPARRVPSTGLRIQAQRHALQRMHVERLEVQALCPDTLPALTKVGAAQSSVGSSGLCGRKSQSLRTRLRREETSRSGPTPSLCLRRSGPGAVLATQEPVVGSALQDAREGLVFGLVGSKRPTCAMRTTRIRNGPACPRLRHPSMQGRRRKARRDQELQAGTTGEGEGAGLFAKTSTFTIKMDLGAKGHVAGRGTKCVRSPHMQHRASPGAVFAAAAPSHARGSRRPAGR